MPAFANFDDGQLYALVDFLMSGKSKELPSSEPPPPEMKYRFTGYHKFLDPDGYPAIAPPWGTLSAINLNTGEYVWKINLGEYPELAAKGLKNTGTENYGGPVVTAGGLVFIGASDFDKKFRAYDKATGRIVVGNDAAFFRECNSGDLRREWTPICCDRCGRRQGS